MSREILPFKPAFGISSGYWQTILGSFGFPLRDPPSRPLIVPVSDNDRLYCLESTPERRDPRQPIIVLVHGLGGCSRSRYMVRLSRYLYGKNRHVVRINLRGSGPGEGMARKPCNAGQSDDVFAVCKLLKERYPESPLQIVGFSLSGNIVLKMLGEQGTRAASYVEKAIAVCPSVDLKEGVIAIGKPENRLFEKYYLDALLKIVSRKRKIYENYPVVDFPDPLSIYLFDEMYTAPLSGYKNADEYYEKCSSHLIIKNITVPTAILYSLDDPIIPATALERLELSPCVKAYATEHGGHLGFLSYSGRDFWLRRMDRIIIQFLCEVS